MILDFGCGDGRRWSGENNDVVGIDINLARLTDAKSRISLVQCDGRLLPFRNSIFSLIISDSVLEHIPDYKRAISEIRRVLSTDGLWKIFQPVDNDPIFIVARRVARNWMGDRIYSYFSSGQLLEILSSFFKVVSVAYVPNPPINGVFAFFNKKPPTLLQKIDYVYALICQKLTPFHWEVIIEATKLLA